MRWEPDYLTRSVIAKWNRYVSFLNRLGAIEAAIFVYIAIVIMAYAAFAMGGLLVNLVSPDVHERTVLFFQVLFGFCFTIILMSISAGTFLAPLMQRFTAHSERNQPTTTPSDAATEENIWHAMANSHVFLTPEIQKMLIGLPIESVHHYLVHHPKPKDDAAFTTPYSEAVNLRNVLHDVMRPMQGKGYPAYEAYYQNAKRLTAMLPTTKQHLFQWPQYFKGTNAQVEQEYLRNNPLKPLFEAPVPYPIYDDKRFEHHWIIANSGHGKTQTLQHMIAHDLERVQRGECSIVVIDSQPKMIPLISKLQVFAEGQPLDGKLIYLDPANTPPAINLLRLKSNNINQLLELYTFIITSLMGNELRPNQSTVFENCVMLLRQKEGTTIRDLYGMLSPKGLAPYQHHIPKLDEFARTFFNEDWPRKGANSYEENKEQVRRRLNHLLRQSPFKEMFSEPEHRFDLPTELEKGKVILVHTAGLGGATRLFGRFVLALLVNAMQNRTENSLPCFVYIDECDQYVKDDPSAVELSARARKANMGLIFAHRWIDEIGAATTKALESNTAIVFAGGLRGTDAAHMSKLMECDPALLRRPKSYDHTIFTASVRGLPITTLKVPFGTLEKHTPMRKPQYQKLMVDQAKQYGVGQKFDDVSDEPDSYD